ncbi:hypothetical protein PISMIDRAFT_680753 [Pisolithus microcarpus 441]|uniref:Uncharacterized protein n=1 Tax=Pisolithus microcarpus 441 TaxID=765257 RepID=A0A0C9Z7Q0_9AGAM|nr:hypothetical protein BKA83DRAFT_680753 [Pisolithus microcarpus]KIK21994.1 hypothetical protein PISMIDRAFT_680753 [Pisolithus microcarpus 441]
MKPDSNDWVSAQSALRRRVAQQRYPSGTGRNEKVRNATIKQRIYAILWLIASSKGVAELFASHGCTPPTFRIPEIASILSRIIYNHWDVFPSQTDDWESALTRSKEDGCKCSPADCRGIREWFDMVVWLGGIPPVLEVGDKPCVRCRSLLKSRYEDIAAKCTVTSHVSLLDAFCNYRDCETEVAFLPHLSPTAKLQANRILEPLMKKHGYDVRYSPPVNRYSECLRPWVAKLQCISNPSYQDGLPTAGLPDNIFDGVNDPWVVLGIIMSASYDPSSDSGTDLHDEDWHRYFSTGLRSSLQCFDMPVLPRLSSMGFTLCHALDQDGLEERSFSRVFRAMDASEWVKSDQDGRQLRLATAVIVAVTTFLRSKRDVDLYSCRRCQVVCMEFFDSRPSAVGCEVANSGDHDNALEGSLSSPSDALLCSLLTHSMQRQHLYSLGLDTPNCVQRSDSGNRPCLGESTLRRHLSGRSISSSSMRSKSDKVEEIKDKLLGELNLPYERLPWYTLEKDLKKHGCALVNWPAGVLRKRGNRGIHDLSAVEVNSLYEAVASPDESRRLRICRCPSTLTVAPVQPVNRTSAAASGSKRPMGPEETDFPGHPSKRIRDMTSKVSQQHFGEPREDGTVGS